MFYRIAQSPGLICLLLLAASYFLLPWKLPASAARRICVACGGLSVAAYVVIFGLNLGRPGMLWHDEGNILSIAAAFLHGQPMYHTLHGSDFYALFYGPATFLLYAPFFAVFSKPLPAMRIFTFILAMAEMGLVLLLLRRILPWAESLALLAFAPWLVLSYPMQFLAFRGDLLLLVCVSAAFVFAMPGRRLHWAVAGGAAGIAIGVAIDFKLTVAPIACVLFALIVRTRGARAAYAAVAGCCAAALGVFLLPHISLRNYLAWMAVAGHQRILPSTLALNVDVAAAMVAPLLLLAADPAMRARMRFEDWVLAALGAMALLVLIVTGSKDGAGGWHLAPMLPVALAAAAWTARVAMQGRSFESGDEDRLRAGDATAVSPRVGTAFIAIAVAGLGVSLLCAARDLHAVCPPHTAQLRAREAAAKAALGGILSEPVAGRTFAMAPGDSVTDYRSDLRFLLPVERVPYFFDENAVIEGRKARFAIPAQVTARIAGCQDVWIVPHGQTPFSATTVGILPASDGAFIFPEALREQFLRSHVLYRQGPVYDLWQCAGKPRL